MSPSLALTLRVTAQRHRVSEEAIRTSFTIEALAARRAFCWLAVQLTEQTTMTIGMFLGRAHDRVEAFHNDVDARRLVDPDFAAEMDEAAIEVLAEAGVRRALGRADDEPADAVLVARRVASSYRAACSASARDITTMAAAILAYAETFGPSPDDLPAHRLQPRLLGAAGALLAAEERLQRGGLLDWQVRERRQLRAAALTELSAVVEALRLDVGETSVPQETDHDA